MSETKKPDPAVMDAKPVTPLLAWGVYWFGSMLGGAVFGVGVPVLLTSFHHGYYSMFRNLASSAPREIPLPLSERIQETVGLFITGSILCGPGVLILGSLVFARCIQAVREGLAWRAVWLEGTLAAMLLAFLNLPGWLCTELMRVNGEVSILRVIVLFLVAGAAAGTWISRMAWKAVRRDERFFVPTFSLKTLLILVFVWGALLAVFAPRA